MATFNASKIIVWERATKLGKWCPYSAPICQFLEENYQRNKTSTVNLGDVDEELKIYSLDFNSMIQTSEATGTKLSVRRRLCDSLSALGRGFTWQWLDDSDCWNSYDAVINDFIDCAFLEGKKSIGLNRKFPGNHYEIIFDKMIQINKRSKRKRKVRRSENTLSYPVTTCSDDLMDIDKKECNDDEVQKIFSPEYLRQEIPGTRDLENQVNAYKRNVEGSECINSVMSNFSVMNSDIQPNAKHVKYSTTEEKQGEQNQLEQSSSVFPTTVALVNGKPWSDHRPPHTPQSKLKPVPGIDPLPKFEKPKKTKQKGAVVSCPEEICDVLEKFCEEINLSEEIQNETCIICYEPLSVASSYDGSDTLSKLTLCSHIFHKACIEAMYNSGNKEFLQCPSCKKIHGEKCGIQPPGEMIYHVLPYSLPGYPENDTIRVIYNIHSGIQGPEHPYPGRRYTARGFPRNCYLPDNEMGRKVLRLLIKAWKRRLIFTIGRSSTTGEENTVTWNEIHHKTEFGFNRYGHGYPDPNYFSNVLAELEAHGVIDDEERVWSPV